MPIDPIPLPDGWQNGAVDRANAMVAQHWVDVWNLINGARQLLMIDAGSQDEGSANEQDAFYAGESFGYAAESLFGMITELTTSWTASGANSWQGPAATTFANLYNSLYTYVSELQEAAVLYSAAARDAGFAHRTAKAAWFKYMYDWMYNTSHIREGIENQLFHPATEYDRKRAYLLSSTGQEGKALDSVDEWQAEIDELISWGDAFIDGYSWADSTFVMNYNSLHYIGYVGILPGLSGTYGESYLGLKVVPEPDFPAVDKKNDPFAQEKDNLKKEEDDLKNQQDLFTKQQKDAEDAAATAQKDAQKQAADQEALLNKQQADAQDQMNAQQKQLADQSTQQQDQLAKQQADAQDQMNAQQKQLADQAAKQQANLDNLPANAAVPNPTAPDMGGLTTPAPLDAPAVPGGLTPAPGGSSVVTAPDGTLGLDTNGTVTPLPPGAKTVKTPNGTSALDVNGDGIADTDLNGTAIPGGSAPPGSRLVTDQNGKPGYDINGDGKADLDLNGNALPGGSLPAGSRFVTGPDGRQGFDLTGDGIPDTDSRGMPLQNSPYFSALPTPQLVTTLPPTQAPALNPANQIQMPPPAPSAAMPPAPAAPAVAGATATGAAGGYPPMYPPMGGMGGMGGGQGDRGERERQTWLQEEDEVWAGDTAALAAVSQLGRPVEDEEEPEDWEVPVRPASRPVPRQPRPGQLPTSTRR